MHAGTLHHGRGSLAMDIDGKWRALIETFAGMGLMSLPFWSKFLDDVVAGSHYVTAICGALIGIHGVWRLFFRNKRRKADKFMGA